MTSHAAVDPEAPRQDGWRIAALRIGIAVIAVAALITLASSIREIETFRGSLPDIAANVFLGYVLAAVTAGLACVLALVIVWRASARADARFLALFLALLAFFWGSIFHFLHVAYGMEGGKQQLTINVTMGGARPPAVLAAIVLSAAAFLNFAALFPVAARRPRWSTTSRIWVTALVIAALDFVPTYVDLADLMDDVITRAPKSLIPLGFAYLAITHIALPLVAVILGVVLLVWNYRHAGREERRSAGWVVAAFAVALSVLLVALLLAVFELAPEDSPTAFAFVLVVLPSIAPLVFVVSLAIAVFYTGTFDPGLVIRKTTIYASVGVVLTGLFALVENLISGTLAHWLNLPDSVSTVAGSIAVALAVVPLRDRFARIIERRGPAAEAASAAPPRAQDV